MVFFDLLINRKISWHLKRRFLNIVWVLINFTVLIIVTDVLLGSGWELIWCLGAIIYSSFSWILATLFFDALIGNEYDQKKRIHTD